MKYSGVIFDFNGTLFWDTPLHNKAWNMFLEKRGMHLSDHEFFATFHGKNNRDIFNSLFQREHPAEEIRALVESEKKAFYIDHSMRSLMKKRLYTGNYAWKPK